MSSFAKIEAMMTAYRVKVERVGFGEQEAYWQKHLGGLSVAELPLDYPRPPVQSFFRASESLEIAEPLYSILHAFCGRDDVTLFILLLGAWKILLVRYTGREDIVVGSLSSDSVREGEGGSPETFVNLVGLRTSLGDDPTAEAVLQRAARTIAEAAQHRDYPFAKLVEYIAGDKDFTRAPIFQTLLVLCNVSGCLSEAAIAEGDILEIEEYAAQCDLVMVASEEGGSLNLRCEYDAQLFEAATIRRVLRHLRTLLQTVRFSDGLQLLLKEPKWLFLEVGPGQTLSSLAKQHPDKAAGQVMLASMRAPHDRRSDVSFLLNAIGRLWLEGAQVHWPEFYAHERRQRVPLPTYPFECRRFWIEPQKKTYSRSTRPRPLDPDVAVTLQDSTRRMAQNDVSPGPVLQLDLFMPEHTRPELNHSYAAPRNPTERTLADIWQQLLGLELVGIHDNFFDLGGHSLLAIQIMARVCNTFHVHLPVHAVFENPTIAGLAAQIADALTDAIVVSDEAADMLAELKRLSDEEAERLLDQESPKGI